MNIPFSKNNFIPNLLLTFLITSTSTWQASVLGLRIISVVILLFEPFQYLYLIAVIKPFQVGIEDFISLLMADFVPIEYSHSYVFGYYYRVLNTETEELG